MRGFNKVSIEEFSRHRPQEEYPEIMLPKRATQKSAGYDFYLPYPLRLFPGEEAVVATGIKAFMEGDEVLFLIIRSSLGFRGLRLKNQVGVIDADYYDNPQNEGHILVAVENNSKEVVSLNAGERFVQGIFLKYLVADEETQPLNERRGGIGSTEK